MNTWWKTYLTNPIINCLGEAKAEKKFDRPPVLIGGCARSGTTLLLAMISAHPSIHAFSHEVDAFTEWADGKPVRIDRLHRAMLLDRIKSTANRWCEKRPYNVRFIAELHGYFGSDMRFIHIVRDPRAVCTSFHPTNPDSYWVGPARWKRDVQAGMAFGDDSYVKTIRYEDLVLNPESLLTEVCEFLGEDYTVEMKQWHQHATVRSNRAWFDQLSDVQRDSLDKWKAYEHKERVAEILSDPEIIVLMERFDYL